MKEAGFTKQERNFLSILRAYVVLFLFTAAVCAVAPDWFLEYLSAIGRGIFGWYESPLNLGNAQFWLVLAASFFVTLAYVCFFIQSDFLRRIEYSTTIIIAKFLSAAGFFICFFAIEQRFFYLVGAVVDGLIFIITLAYYNSAAKSRSR